MSGVGVGCSYPRCHILAYTPAVTGLVGPVQSMKFLENWCCCLGYKVCTGIPQYWCEAVELMSGILLELCHSAETYLVSQVYGVVIDPALDENES